MSRTGWRATRARSSRELRQLQRALLGDAFSEGEHLEAMEPEERARLPLPFAGVIRR
jgi:hypothetical protein